MLVDDLVVVGAEPLFVTDYIATGRVVPERIAAIVQGIAEACIQAGAALLGGETAEHPGLLEPDEYDVAGSTTGVVERCPGPRPSAPATSSCHGVLALQRVLCAMCRSPCRRRGRRPSDRHVDGSG
jgi:phosphoribosylformylglycinamidine cyclo-ligase